MPVAKPETSDARVIAHIDMDCFYVQVEQRKRPELRGLPTAVVQYNSWKGGALIAVGYEARKFGVKRSMRGDEAKSACPEIQLVQVPVARNKADLNSYRDAGSEVVAVLSQKGRCERASIDEVYLDLTEAAETMMAGSPPENLEAIEDEALKSHILGLSHEDVSDAKENVRKWLCRSDADDRDKLLACGALIVADLRMKVLKETEFTCSAGIAHNKMLAKLASAMNKPAQQTVVPSASVEGLLSSFPIRKMKQLGGKLGSSLQNDMSINVVGDLLQYSKQKLQDRYGINTGAWLWNISRGIDGEEVQGRLLPKSHGSGKTFPGPRALKTISSVQQWLNELCEELHERLCSDLEKNKRMAQTLTLHARAYKHPNNLESDSKFPSKSCPLRYGTSKIQEDALNLFQAGLREYIGSSSVKTQGTKCCGWGITGLSISASKIVSIPSGTNSIIKYFSGSASGKCKELTQEDVLFSSTGSDSLAGCDSSEIEIPWQEAERETLTEQLSDFVGRNTSTDQVPSNFSTKEAEDGVTPEPSLFSTEGTENCSRLDQVEQKGDGSVEEYRITNDMPNLEHNGHKRNTSKDKGQEIPSILRFFKNDNGSCSSQLEHVKTTHSSQKNYGAEAWRYKIDEIDTSILDELPPEIREEVQMWIRPQKKANTVHRKSSITHYFAPSRST